MRTENFDPWSHKYRCCCGCMHSKTGCIVVGLLDILIFGSQFAFLLREFLLFLWNSRSTFISTGLFYADVGITGLVAFSTLFLFFAICTGRAWLLVPYMIWRVFSIFLFLIVIVLCTVLFFIGWEQAQNALESLYGYRFTPEEVKLLKDAFTLGSIVVIGFFVLCLIFNFWFFCVVKSCFRYLEDFQHESRALRYGVDIGNGGHGSHGGQGGQQLLLQPVQNHVPHPPPPPAVAPPPYPPYNNYQNLPAAAVKNYGYPAYSYDNLRNDSSSRQWISYA